MSKKLFQFLIGTLKTLVVDVALNIDIPVSIPYRHSKNWAERQGLSEEWAFQFLIGTLKTWRMYYIRC